MKNVIKLILRNLIRKPVITSINLLGLSISLALVIILAAYSYSEFTTDKFHKNHQNIYLVQPGEGWVFTPAVLKPTADANIAGIKKSIRMRDKSNPPVYQFEDEDPVESDLIFSDEDFFELFDYSGAEGDLKTALQNPMSVVISKQLATRLFGDQPAVGKTLKLNNKHLLTVTAVLNVQPSNTLFSFSSITNIETMKRVQTNNAEDFTNWGWNNYQTFLLLDDEVIPSSVESEIIKLYPEEDKKEVTDLKLIPLHNIYFTDHGNLSFIKSGNKLQVVTLSVVALLILIVALVNFINISAAQWRDQIKQTGILKVIGAKRIEVMLKILFETYLLFMLAFVFACLITYIIIPVLAHETAITFNPRIVYSGTSLSISLGMIFILSLLCGIFPALRIASSETLINLKKKIIFTPTKTFGKGTLVSAQFVVAIILILFTILIQKQVEFGSSNLGMNQENIIGIEFTDQLSGKKDVLKDELLAQANVEEVIFTQYYPGKMNSGWGLDLQQNGEEKHVEFRTFSADAGFFDIMGLQLLKGQFYSGDLETDKHKVIVNEQFCREYGITDPIGAVMPRYRGPEYKIVGVVKDFHFRQVNEPIAPLVIRNDNYASIAMVKLKTENFKALRNTFENIQSMTAELSPSFPVSVSFFDQAVEHLYQEEVKFRKAFTLFAVCAIVISCMGILAMSMFAAQDRIKEIGIRKVNGAKVTEILTMLNKDFVKWVAIAFVIATPIAYYAMHKWLENFAYKTTLSWWIFALAGLLALGIALLTVSFQSWKAATKNPVESLRYE
ncbi:MAG: ABC transporter permease [Draconibacterium sp.]